MMFLFFFSPLFLCAASLVWPVSCLVFPRASTHRPSRSRFPVRRPPPPSPLFHTVDAATATANVRRRWGLSAMLSLSESTA